MIAALFVDPRGCYRPPAFRDVLGICLGIETAKQDQGAAVRAGRCLAQLEWEVVARDGGGSRERFYAKRVAPVVVEPDPAEAWARE